ncbi:MAG: signal peptide peptidase SppA [Candidatus Cloacimonadota bacterium]|nr:MAG: signal peptide peptidase SppA [Candidatus Cloacimonadota bacterium]
MSEENKSDLVNNEAKASNEVSTESSENSQTVESSEKNPVFTASDVVSEAQSLSTMSLPEVPTIGVMPLVSTIFLVFSILLGLSISGSSKNISTASTTTGVSIPDLFGKNDSAKEGIAVVRVYGAIQTSSDGGMFSQKKGADAIVERLKKIGKDKRVKAVVIRLNTPGGTVGASQEIHSEILKLKKMGKKIVVSMADVCASGGVYIAVAADRILANRGTITGSVGVVFSVQNLKELMAKIGVKANTITSGKFKDIGSMWRDMRTDEKALLQGIVDSTFDQFLTAVAEGRNLSKDEVRKWADGRIFNGDKALEHKLIDELGTFEDALKVAQKLAGLKDAHIVKAKTSPMEQFKIMFQGVLNPFGFLQSSMITSSSPLLFHYQPGRN